ncbi:hypothetical protein BgiBS90_013960, partial [Biomphalaria glabrata]
MSITVLNTILCEPCIPPSQSIPSEVTLTSQLLHPLKVCFLNFLFFFYYFRKLCCDPVSWYVRLFVPPCLFRAFVFRVELWTKTDCSTVAATAEFPRLLEATSGGYILCYLSLQEAIA